MAQKIPFFELFTDFSPDFDLRVPLNAAMVTNMVLEPEKRTMTLDMTVRAEMNDSTRETVEQLLARNYDLKRVDIHVKSTAEAFPDMLKNAGRKVSGSGSAVGGVIGYLRSLNKFDDIANNYYASGCGAKYGIGAVQ